MRKSLIRGFVIFSIFLILILVWVGLYSVLYEINTKMEFVINIVISVLTALLGGFISIIVVVISLETERKKTDDQNRLSLLPRISSRSITLIREDQEPDDDYEYISVDGSEDSDPIYRNYVRIIFKNVGLGNAIDFEVNMINNNNLLFTREIDSIATSENFEVMILFTSCDKNRTKWKQDRSYPESITIVNIYQFQIQYSDLCGTPYKQTASLLVSYTENRNDGVFPKGLWMFHSKFQYITAPIINEEIIEWRKSLIENKSQKKRNSVKNRAKKRNKKDYKKN